MPSEVTAALIGASAVIFTKSLEMLYKYFNERKKNKNDEYHYINKDYEIDRLLWNVHQHYDIDRVYVCQFHNGGTYKSGMSMQKFTMTNEIVSDKVEMAVISLFKERLTSEFTTIFKELMFNKKYEIENNKQQSTKNPHLNIFNEGTCLLYTIQDFNKAPLGFLGFHFIDNKTISQEQKELFASTAQSLLPLLKK